MDAVLVYDDQCRFCAFMAELVAKRSGAQIKTLAWTLFRESPTASRLYPSDRVAETPPHIILYSEANDTLLQDTEAWHWLLDNYRDLKAFAWLARKLGFEPEAATLLQRAAYRFKRMCSRC